MNELLESTCDLLLRLHREHKPNPVAPDLLHFWLSIQQTALHDEDMARKRARYFGEQLAEWEGEN